MGNPEMIMNFFKRIFAGVWFEKAFGKGTRSNECNLYILERIISIAPEDKRQKIDMARTQLRELMKIDRDTFFLAIAATFFENNVEAAKQFSPPP